MSKPKPDEFIVSDDGSVGASSVQQEESPPYLKLIADCWYHVFDYLPLKDVIAVGETCKKLHQMAGYYVSECCPEFKCRMKYHGFDEKRDIEIAMPYYVHVPTKFYQFIKKLQIEKISKLNYILDDEQFSSLKALIFYFSSVKETQFGYTQNILKNVEKIEFISSKIKTNVFEQIANTCSKLKHLQIRHYILRDNAFDALFLQHYPNLEHLEFAPRAARNRIDNLKIFLEKHSKLVHLDIEYNVLTANKDSLIETNVRLDLLTVQFTEPIDSVSIIDLLKMLFDRGFYKRLHLSMCSSVVVDDHEHFNDALSTLPALEILGNNNKRPTPIDLTRLTSLKELNVDELDDFPDSVDLIAKSLTKLERLIVGSATINDILPFIQNSPRLKMIQVNYFSDIFGVLDLFALNRERQKLVNASQVLIHVKENFYLAVKWKLKNNNLSYVKVARPLPPGWP